MALSTHIQKSIRKAFEQDCFELLINAYRLALSKNEYQLQWNENDFNEQICEYIRLDNTYQNKGIVVETEHKLFCSAKDKLKGFADKLPRIDFAFHRWQQYTCMHYMEAKRLKEKDSILKRAYINEGMDRFISKKYPLGNMIGYLVEGKEQKTIEGINKLLASDGRSTEILVSEPHPLHGGYYESSNHTKIVLLKHLILDFT